MKHIVLVVFTDDTVTGIIIPGFGGMAENLAPFVTAFSMLLEC